MFIVQFLWPLIGVAPCLGIDIQPARIVEESKEVGFLKV
jgi:hypothetical protein